MMESINSNAADTHPVERAPQYPVAAMREQIRRAGETAGRTRLLLEAAGWTAALAALFPLFSNGASGAWTLLALAGFSTTMLARQINRLQLDALAEVLRRQLARLEPHEVARVIEPLEFDVDERTRALARALGRQPHTETKEAVPTGPPEGGGSEVRAG
jgi:hypothetical protein